MTSNSDSVDERIMCLVGMGFDLEDCQLAIQNGKLRVEDAVEWLLNGKPNCVSNSNPTLKLHFNQSDEMDTGSGVPNESQAIEEVESAMNTEGSSQIQTSDHDLTTRLFVSEEQRRVKLQFEEKQRLDARRQALTEKQAKKKAHEEAMRKIHESRESRGYQPASSNVVADVNLVVSAPLRYVARRPNNEHLTSAEPPMSLIKIRLPCGQLVRRLFSGNCILRDVIDLVSKQCSISSFLLIQPFPRVEFTAEFHHKTLKELGLVPSGSLVLKVTPTGAADVVGNIQEDADIAEVAGNIADDNDNDDGPGSHVGNTPPHGMEQPPDAGPGLDDLDPRQAFHPGFPGVVGGGFHGDAMGVHGFGRGHVAWGGIVQHDWGSGQALTGEVLANVALPYRIEDQRQLAAEAASRRHVTDLTCPPTSDQEPVVRSTLPTTVAISSLRLLVIKYLTADICSARPTFYGLHGLPGSLALQILNNVVKEGLLRPKILQFFVSCHLNDISLDTYPYCTNELLSALRHHIHLKSVSLKGCCFINHHGLQHLVLLKNLRVLNLGSCRKISDEVIPVLIAMPSLVVLNLEDTAVTNAGVVQYARSQPPCLQVLDIGRTSVTQDCLSALQAIPCLKQLNLEQTKVTGLAGIEGLSQLHTLNLSDTSLVTESMLCLRSLPALTVLNIANNVNVNGDMALQYISDLRLTYLQLPNRITTTDYGMCFLTNMPLAMLDLTNFIYITDVSMEYIGRIVTLQKLRLSNTKITDSGLQFLEGLRDLEELQIDRTLLSDDGLRVVAAFSRLLELNLSHTGVTNKFLMSGALNQCRQLSKLNLSSTNVSDKGLVRLQLPQLTMLNIDNTYCQPDVMQRLSGCPSVASVTFRSLRIPPKNEDF